MDRNISPLLYGVNKPAVLTDPRGGNKLPYMRYGERLRAARKGLGWTQQKLAEEARINQSLISQLEKSLTATGSEYTPRMARAMGINVDWLADEIGGMQKIQGGGGGFSAGEPPPSAYLAPAAELPADVVHLAKRIAALPADLRPGLEPGLAALEAAAAARAASGNAA